MGDLGKREVVLCCLYNENHMQRGGGGGEVVPGALCSLYKKFFFSSVAFPPLHSIAAKIAGFFKVSLDKIRNKLCEVCMV